MSCNSTGGKTCRDKSCQRYYNTNPQTLAAGDTLQLAIAGARVVDNGLSIETQPQSFTTLKTGLYHFAADVVITASAAGDVTLQILMDGVVLPCTIRTATVVANGTREIHTETDLALTGCCCDVTHSFTLALVSEATAAGTVNQVCAGVLKIANL